MIDTQQRATLIIEFDTQHLTALYHIPQNHIKHFKLHLIICTYWWVISSHCHCHSLLCCLALCVVVHLAKHVNGWKILRGHVRVTWASWWQQCHCNLTCDLGSGDLGINTVLNTIKVCSYSYGNIIFDSRIRVPFIQSHQFYCQIVHFNFV